jgi:hypothetical protein
MVMKFIWKYMPSINKISDGLTILRYNPRSGARGIAVIYKPVKGYGWIYRLRKIRGEGWKFA